MAKVIDEKINSIETSWEGYTGKRVEDFIKNQLKGIDTSKFGYMAVESGDVGLQIMRFFKDVQSYEQWFTDRITYENNVLSVFEFYSNRPEAKFTTKATIVKYLNTNIAKGANNTFSLSYNCYWDNDPTQKDTSNGLMEVSVNGVKITELSKDLVPSGVAQGNVYTIDLQDYLVSETNKIVIKVTNSHGFDKTFTFNVTVYDLRLTFDSNYDESIVQKGKWNLRVNCSGTAATVYCKVTNNTSTDIYTKDINNSSGEFIIDPNNNYVLGVHNITIWAENKALGLKTEELTTTYVKGSDLGNAVPALCFGKAIPTSVKQFSIINIPYYFYLPNDTVDSTVVVSIELLYDNDSKTKVLSTQNIIINSTHTSGLRNIVVAVDDGNYLPYITIKIKVGYLSITKRIDVENIGVIIKDVDECKVHYNMKGKTNDDEDAKNLTSIYNGDITSKFVRSNNFNLDTLNGFIDGYSMTIRPGKTLTLQNYLPFAVDCGANGNKQGKTIEFEFKSGICADENDVIIDCWSNGVGFKVYVNRIIFGCNTGIVTTYFPEQERIKVSFVIDGTTVHTRNDLGGNNIIENDANLAYLYVNGVIVRIFDYKSGSWQQGDIKNIVVGSPTALVQLYSLRIYDKALTYNQILNNYIYDMPDINDVYDGSGNFVRYGKISTAKRNDILNTIGDVHKPQEIVSKNKLVAALPNTPIIEWNIDNLPFNKNNPDVPINSTSFVNPQWIGGEDYACAPFEVGAHMFNADGTSSNSYPLPYKNFAEIFETADGNSVNITLDPKNTSKVVTAYSITKGLSKGETELVHKVNFASSEGIFNIHAMNMFQKILLACAKTDDSLYTKFQKQQRDASEPITFRKSLSGFPEIGFRKTSTSGVESSTFLSFYNLINNKYNATIFGFPKKDYKTAQIWEIDENVNFFNRYGTLHSLDGSTLKKSNLTGQPIYYARIPKKSPTNKNLKFGAIKSATDNIEAANKELAVIRRFHNWVVDCNYHLAERYYKQHGDYKTLDQSVIYNGVVYTKDTPEYRKAKFVNEAPTYIIKNDAIFYFIFIVYIIGMDSGDKNMSIAFDDIITESDGNVTQAHARLFLRDTDSRDLFNNSGVLTFKYWHEWNDSYNAITGRTLQMNGEDYDSDSNTWSPHLEQGFTPVFNGRYSGLLDLIWSCWEEDIKTIYKLMQSNGLNATDMFQQYIDYWKQLCENIYNVDAMGYVNTNNFEKAYGDKLQLSKYFYQKRSRYLDSKNCCGQSVVNNLRLRLYNNGKGLAIKHYSPMYASVQWGANNFATQRSIDGDYALIPFGFSNPQNATFDIDDADMITDIKTYSLLSDGNVKYYGFEGLGDFYFDANMGLCKSLTDFVMRYTAELPNTLEQGVAFDLSKMTLLKRVVCTHVKNLNKIIEINSEICEEIDFTGSGITGIKCLPNQYLKKLVLPASIKELNLTGFTNLEQDNLIIEDYSNIEKLVINDCPKLEINTILNKVISNNKLVYFSCKNINITITNRKILTMIIERADKNITGRIHCGIALTQEEKLKLIAKYGNITNSNNPLYITYNIITLDNGEIQGDDYVFNTNKENKLFLYKFPQEANNIKSISWTMENNRFGSINRDTGVITVNNVSQTNDDEDANVNVVCNVTLDDDTTRRYEKTIKFCKHAPTLWDYVYVDKTISDKWRTDISLAGVIIWMKDNNIRIAGMCTPYLPGFDRTILLSNNTPIEPKDEYNLNSDILIDNNYILDHHRRGTLMPYGQVSTLNIIQYRNSILNDTNINIQKPVTDSNSTEFEKVINMSIEKGYKINQAMSAAYAYQPKTKINEIIADEFKEHNWYIGTSAEYSNIGSKLNYRYKGIIDNKFNSAIQVIEFSHPNIRYKTSQRTKTTITTIVPMENYYIYNGNDDKDSCRVIPMCSFFI